MRDGGNRNVSIIKFKKHIAMNSKESVKNQAGDCPNDLAQLRAAQNENNTKDESGALAAAPCSAPFLAFADWNSPMGVVVIACLAFGLGSIYATSICAWRLKKRFKRLDEE